MHKKFKDIATKYEIAEETSKQILAGLKIKNIDKNPSQFQLEGFESVCNLVKEGTDLALAVARVSQSWRQSENNRQIGKTAVKIGMSSSNGHHPRSQDSDIEMATTTEIADICAHETKLVDLTQLMAVDTQSELKEEALTEINFDEEEF